MNSNSVNFAFEAELFFYKEDGNIYWTCDYYEMVSSIEHLSKKCDFDYDLLDSLKMEEERFFKDCKENQVYRVFGFGNVYYENDINWETGVPDGEWVFEFENVKFYEVK